MEEVLQIGSQGENVRQLQAQLNAEGYEIQVDSIFGEETYGAVIKFQMSNGLETDGIVDTETASRLGMEEFLAIGSEWEEEVRMGPEAARSVARYMTSTPTPTPTPTPNN